jgi:23S rRNA A1618 N6-methylase RlmF
VVKGFKTRHYTTYYGIHNWDIPETIWPSDTREQFYIHYIADLLAFSNNGSSHRRNRPRLDIGIGAELH